MPDSNETPSSASETNIKQGPFLQHGQRKSDRRCFLQAAGALAIGAAASPRMAVHADEPAKGWIDAHVHVWTPDVTRYPLATGFTPADMQPASFEPAELLAHCQPVGVTRITLIQMSFYGTDNSYMLDVMQQQPGVFSGVAVIDEQAQPVAEMKRLARRGVRGFRIRPGDRNSDQWLAGDGMQQMWKCGADERLAMCHLINPEFLSSVERMCAKNPRTPVVIDHFARVGIDGTIRDSELDNLCRLSRFPEVTVKVSAFYALGKKAEPYRDLGPMIQRLVREYGAERLMWASDCPYQVQTPHTYRASIDLIQQGLPFLTQEQREWLLRRTAERVFFS